MRPALMECRYIMFFSGVGGYRGLQYDPSKPVAHRKKCIALLLDVPTVPGRADTCGLFLGDDGTTGYDWISNECMRPIKR